MPPSPSTSRISKRPPSTSPGCSWFCFGKIFESRGFPAGGVDGPSTNVAPSSSRGMSLGELSPFAGARIPAGPSAPVFSGLAFFGLGSSIQLLDADVAHHYALLSGEDVAAKFRQVYTY